MIDKKSPLLQVQPQYNLRAEWEVLASAENLSYEVLDISMPPALTESGLFEEYLSWYSSCGRVSSLHGCFIDVNPASNDPDIRQVSQSRCKKSCETAKALGAKNVVFHSACFPFLRGDYLDAWAAQSAEYFQELAESFDLCIFIENSMDVDAAPLRALMERKKDPRIGVCLDIGHAAYSRMPVKQWFEELGEWIGYLHLSDNKGLFDDHLPLQEGCIDWKEADLLWRELKKDTIITLEVGDCATAQAAVRFLKKNEYFGQSLRSE